MKNTGNLEQLTRSMVKSKFSEYYRRNKTTLIAPSSMQKREFGFLLFTEGVMVRHKSFRQINDLRNFIENIVPSDAYYSAAYYSDPEAPMDKKGWSGADLIFDIDADHIETECKKKHDKWLCGNCNSSGSGKAPQNCPSCGAQKLKEDTWICNDCLEKAKDEILRLINLLNVDFGIDISKMSANFSGHRGYHLHIDSEETRNLDSEGRKEIVDYITGTGLDLDLLGIFDLEGKFKVMNGLKTTDPSWRGKIAKRIHEILLQADEDELKNIGLKSNVIESLMSLRDKSRLDEKDRLWGTIEGAGRQTWQLITKKASLLESIAIDTVVTTDTHRLIRIPGTLNGKTGLKAMHVDIDSLKEFNPLNQAVVFEGKETVYIQGAQKFQIGGDEYGPFSNSEVTLPTTAAIFLLCKGKAFPLVR